MDKIKKYSVYVFIVVLLIFSVVMIFVMSKQNVEKTNVNEPSIINEENSISSNKDNNKVVVPNFVGKSLEQAREDVKNIDIYIYHNYSNSETVPDGVIISQNIAPNEIVGKNTYVTIEVSIGKANKQGNLASNIQHSAVFAKQGNWIYYVDHFGEYTCFFVLRKNLITNEIQNISFVPHEGTWYINVVGEWVYYFTYNSGVHRVHITGGPSTLIFEGNIRGMIVEGDWIYYIESSKLNGPIYKIKADGTQKQLIANDQCAEMNITDEWIYFSRYDEPTNSYDLYRVKKDGSNKMHIPTPSRVRSLNVVDNYIYFTEYSKGIYKIDANNLNNVVNIKEETEYLFVVGDWIYCSDSYKKIVYRIKTDGSKKEILLKDIQCYLAVVGDWLYVKPYGGSNNFSKMRFDGSEFQEASERKF